VTAFSIAPCASAASDSFAPFTVALQSQPIHQSPPSWETGNVTIHPDLDTLSIPVPSLASQDAIGCFALTVVFADNGDGGPVVEWVPKEGDKLLLSAGLGESGIPLGLNARTLLITQSLALDGGVLQVSFAGRFSRLVSVSLRPARELDVAALGSDFLPGLLAADEPPQTAGDVSGQDTTPSRGDRTEGDLVHAELSSEAKLLASSGSGGSEEFIIPISATPQGSVLRTDVAGLDPESWIDVSLNGVVLPPLGMTPTSLNSPSTVFSTTGRLLFAGWQPASLFIPAKLWHQGDNSLVLTLHRVTGDEGQLVYLGKSHLDFLFHPLGSSTAPSPTTTTTSTTPLPPSNVTRETSPETLSTGTLYGNPSPSLFHAGAPLQLPSSSTSR
jgi:hypothetical protein